MWRDEYLVITLPDGTELAYDQEECDSIYPLFSKQRRFLARATAVSIPFPDGEHAFLLSGEGAVLLTVVLREYRRAHHISDPPDIMAR